jgi:hypothetical protein
MSEPKTKDEPQAPAFEEVLKRMLSTPPKQHKEQRVNPKPQPPAKKQP